MSEGAWERISGARIWLPSKVFETARFGKDVNVGAFSEIGPFVCVGDRVRIGAMSFIPDGVTIEEDAWIGPRVTMTNDLYPPSGRENWKKTLIKKGARIGAAVTILPGVTIGERSIIGAGAVVTKDVPPGETWAGVPAKKIEHKEV